MVDGVAENGEPATGVRPPLLESIVNTETTLLEELLNA